MLPQLLPLLAPLLGNAARAQGVAGAGAAEAEEEAEQQLPGTQAEASGAAGGAAGSSGKAAAAGSGGGEAVTVLRGAADAAGSGRAYFREQRRDAQEAKRRRDAVRQVGRWEGRSNRRVGWVARCSCCMHVCLVLLWFYTVQCVCISTIPWLF